MHVHILHICTDKRMCQIHVHVAGESCGWTTCFRSSFIQFLLLASLRMSLISVCASLQSHNNGSSYSSSKTNGSRQFDTI